MGAHNPPLPPTAAAASATAASATAAAATAAVNVPKPSTAAAGATADGSLEDGVREWLKQLRLERYADAFIEDGYDDLRTVAHLTLNDMMDIRNMKKIHARKLTLAATRLQK